MFNIIERVKDFAQRKECTDLLLRSWKKENEDVYADFIRRIYRIKDGDISIVEEMMALACQCCPPELHAFHQWLGDYCKGRIDTTDIPAQMRKWAGEHVDIIMECLTRKHLWVGVNLKTGKVRLMAWKKKDYLMVHSETPKEIWERLSEDVRASIVSQVDMALKKEYHQVSKVERTMTYHAIAFCARLIFLTYAASAGRFFANLYDLVIERKGHLPFCMYYFVVFDHGLTRMAEALNGLLAREDADTEVLTLAKQGVRMLVSHSVNMGVENKATWQKTADKCSPDVWKEVTFLLHQMKGKGGNKKKMLSIDDILIGDKAKLKQIITAFLKQNTEDISLAYLLFVLVRTCHVRESVKYMDFHRAIAQFSHKQYGSDVPQRRYGEIKEFSMREPQRVASYQKAKAIIDEWTERFNQCEGT